MVVCVWARLSLSMAYKIWSTLLFRQQLQGKLETTLTGQLHHWETMPKPKLAKVEALELQVQLLITRLEQSEHEVHALREEIRTRPHGGPPEGMRPGSYVIG